MTTTKPEREWKRLVITIVMVLVLLPTLFGTWLMGSSSGLHFLLTRLTLPEALEIENIEGTLIGGVRLTQVRYHDEKLKFTLDEALLNWRPAALWRNELRAEMLYLQHLRIELPPRDDTPLQLPDIHLPITLQLDDMQINDLEIVRPEWQQPLRINNASLRARANRGGVTVKYLDISSDAVQLSLNGTLHPYADYWHNIELQWQLQLPDLPHFNGSGILKGDLRQTTLQHKLTFPVQAAAQLTLFDLLREPHWQAALQIPRQPLDKVRDGWPSEAVALDARGRGDLQHATIDGFTLDTLDSRLQGRGSLDWQEQFKWQADVGSKRLDLAALWVALDVTKAPMIGVGVRARLSGDLDHLESDDVTLTALDGTIDGNVAVRWRERLQWRTELRARQFELAQLWPLLFAEQIGLPGGRANLDATLSGNNKGMNFEQLTLAAHGASASGSGQLHWQPQLQWQASITGNGIDPAVWQAQRLAEWPGTLATQFKSQGRYGNGRVESELDVKQISGTLRGYPFELRTQLALSGDELEVDAFKVQSAQSHIEAKGHIGDEMKLNLHLDSPQLAQLYPAAAGSMTVNGELHGDRKEPLLQLQLDGKQLAYGNQQTGTLQGRAEVQLFSWRKILLELRARDLQLAGQAIDTMEIDAQGEANDHQLQLQMKMAQLQSTWRLHGAFDNERQRWHGQVTQADLDNPELGLWQIRSPAALEVTASELQLAPLCWNQREAQLCLDMQRQKSVWQGTLQGERFGLALLSPWLPRELEMQGEAGVNAVLHYQPQQPLSGMAQIKIGAGHLSYPIIEGERSEWKFEEGHWQAMLDEHGVRSNLKIALAGKDQISASLELPGYAPLTTTLADQAMKGEISAAFSDLGLLNNLFQEVQGLEGRIELDSRIGGTLTHPALTGQLQLRDGRFEIPRLGLTLSELRFDASSTGSDEVNYRLQMRSGDGTIEAKGQTQLDAREGWPTRITLTGENFEASHIPEARVIVSPNLEMKMARREIWLDGEVLIPQARLEPKEFTTTARASDDVEIVGATERKQRPWQIHNRVRLILGDRVSLYGFGFEGTIGGNLLLIDEPGKITAASGELSVMEGRYRAYGQRLDVEQGQLLFAGGPITNPALDLRAVRHVGSITAGVKVYGPLRQPQFELFSTPAMGQSDALSYLVLGVPLESTTSSSEGAMIAQAALALGLKGGDILARSIGNKFGLDEMRIESTTGKTGEQASLVMGRYLSPRLYVGYGVGLIDAVNTLNLRYQISERWQLKAESGINQSADVIYTIER